LFVVTFEAKEVEMEQIISGRFEVEEVASSCVYGPTARGYVTDGKIVKRALVRVLRDGNVVCNGGYIARLFLPPKLGDVPWLDACLAGSQCWLRLDVFAAFERFQCGDIIEALETPKETAARTKLSCTPQHTWRYRKST
jgi:hypothetical protein